MKSSIVKLSKISWEFKGEKTKTLTHGFHPFHAKFIPQIPRTIIEHLTKEGDTVLDPFCGSGTTLAEAKVLNRNVIGVDISPLAVLITKVKTTPISPDKIERLKLELYKMIKEKKNKSVIPEFPNRDIWYHEKTLKELGNIWGQILYYKEKDRDIFDFFTIALSSILKTSANRSKHWNWAFIGDNVLPKINKYADANKLFQKSLESMEIGMCDFWKLHTKSKSKVLHMDTRNLTKKVRGGIDLIITSPPYCFAVDFNRYYRLSYYWFNWSIDENRDIEIGARSKRAKKCGVDDYFSDMEICIKEFYKVLNHGGYCCFTLGNTKKNHEEISAVERTVDMCIDEGFELIEHTYRELSQQSMAQKRIPKEAVLIFRKK